MTVRDELFAAWAPVVSLWSAWAKPVCFAHIDASLPAAAPLPPVALPPLPPADGRVAVVVDLPAAASVAAAVPLARLGYRPVPGYNAVPGPWHFDRTTRRLAADPHVVVDLRPVAEGLRAYAVDPRAAALPPTAPPAFLLDADRRTGRPGVAVGPGTFDNRSVSLPTDFPSAARLRSAGVERVVLVQATGADPAADLAHTLRRWQTAGLELSLARPDGPPVPIDVHRPRWFGFLWHRALTVARLRRGALGGFGGVLPSPSAG